MKRLSTRLRELTTTAIAWAVGAVFVAALLGWYAAQTFWQHVAALGAFALLGICVAMVKLFDIPRPSANTNTQLQSNPPAIRANSDDRAT
jgi:membrane protein YdbS with pleckstrin-like domain